MSSGLQTMLWITLFLISSLLIVIVCGVTWFIVSSIVDERRRAKEDKMAEIEHQVWVQWQNYALQRETALQSQHIMTEPSTIMTEDGPIQNGIGFSIE